jgi:hypothetical protein
MSRGARLTAVFVQEAKADENQSRLGRDTHRS